jgi:hydroxymethylpyrimidine/phosphomethylpyrimidine kinase
MKIGTAINQVQGKRTVQLAGKSIVLTIAGSDPSGGAGLQADLKTFQQMGVYGMSVVTLLTVQNTQSVDRVMVLEPDFVRQQLRSVLDDIPPTAIKLGALGNAEVIQAVAKELSQIDVPIVVDPVMVSKHGHWLLPNDAIDCYRRLLLPGAFLVTPNRMEAEKLTGISINSFEDARNAVVAMRKMGCQCILLKIGKIEDEYHVCLGLEDSLLQFRTPYIKSNCTHGSGCVLSACITAQLSLGRNDLRSTVDFAIQEVTTAISVGTPIGKGISPVETRVILNPVSNQR